MIRDFRQMLGEKPFDQVRRDTDIPRPQSRKRQYGQNSGTCRFRPRQSPVER